jgi:arylsulfatase A-like enzyme
LAAEPGSVATTSARFWKYLGSNNGLKAGAGLKFSERGSSVGDKQGWNAKIVPPEPIYEARKGEKPRVVASLNVDNRRTMEAEITSRAVQFIKRNASAGKPLYAYIPFSLVHMPTLPNLEFAGKTGNGDWADCLAEMDYRTEQVLDAIKQAGIEDNTLVVFASDNGPEATDPWEGDSGPWRGTYFTAMEGFDLD